MNEFFIKLVNMSISAGWLVLAVLILRLALKKAPKWVNVLMWGIVAVRLICPFSIESALSLIPSAQTIPPDIEMDTTPAIDSGLNVVNDVINPIIVQSNTPALGASVNPLQIEIAVCSYIWILGMIVMFSYTACSYWRLRRRVDTAIRYRDNIFQSENLASPFLLGIIKPRIYLPFQIDTQALEYVIAHEQAHIRRGDYLWKPLGFLLLTIYWFNPLMWVSYVLLCRDIELACDERVIKELDNEKRADYTQALVACSISRRRIAACPIAFGEAGVKERVRSVMNYKKPAFWMVILAVAACVIVAVCFLTDPVEETQSEPENIIEADNSVYGNVIAGLGDNAAYALLEMDYNHNVMLVSEMIYDEGSEKQAAISCDVYYCVDGNVKKLGTLMSAGTAYPISFTNEGIFVASGHDVEKYIILHDEALYLEKGVYEQFDEFGNEKYTAISGNQSKESTKQEYSDLLSEYEKSQVVHFSYGAEGSVNEYKSSDYKDTEASDAVEDPKNHETALEDLQDVWAELARTVESIGLENAYPWDNTAEIKENADALIKMAADETGRFEIYGIMSKKYGTYGLLLNDWIGGEQNWNFEYVPWFYVGSLTEEPILEPDGTGKYVFAYVYDYDDAPLWKECILDCGYDTGHMELIFGENSALISMPYQGALVNALPDVTMNMEKYKSWEGDIEISNKTDKELTTGQWYNIEIWENGKWCRAGMRFDAAWKDLAYLLPAGETTVLKTNWRELYGELPVGKYRILKKVYGELNAGENVHYLAAEFEIN